MDKLKEIIDKISSENIIIWCLITNNNQKLLGNKTYKILDNWYVLHKRIDEIKRYIYKHKETNR